VKLILASASPRRAEILRNAGFHFDIQPALVDESFRPGELPGDYVRRLAAEKARVSADSSGHSGESLFIGADTAVVVDEEVFGKPESEQDARRMLRCLSAATHEVHTGLALFERPSGVEHVVEEITRVTFARLSDHEVDDYIATGEPFGKAGAYAIQGIGGRYISRIEGCYWNVVGFPLARFYSLLGKSRWELAEADG
jgi:septum formation protein